jgi:protein-disulfide isomerase
VLETEPQLIEQYIRSGQVRLVYRHLQQLGEGSELLSQASECAADQGRFWEMRQAIYTRYNQLFGDTGAGARAAAEQVGLDLTAYERCLSAATHLDQVRADYAAATADGVRSRPVFDIGDQRLIGAQRVAVFNERIDAALAGD